MAAVSFNSSSSAEQPTARADKAPSTPDLRMTLELLEQLSYHLLFTPVPTHEFSRREKLTSIALDLSAQIATGPISMEDLVKVSVSLELLRIVKEHLPDTTPAPVASVEYHVMDTTPVPAVPVEYYMAPAPAVASVEPVASVEYIWRRPQFRR